MKSTNNGGGGNAGIRLKDECDEWAVDENGNFWGPDPKGGLVYFACKLLSPPSHEGHQFFFNHSA
jgi:hypothetical protein